MTKKKEKVFSFVQRDGSKISLGISDYVTVERETNYLSILFDLQEQATKKGIDISSYEALIFGKPYGERLFNDVVFFEQKNDIDFYVQESKLCKAAYFFFVANVAIPCGILLVSK